LELICLRCLEKDLARRYSSAEALADDLQRWLAGEPLSVRPASLWVLVRSWVRQNFGAAGWTVIIGLACGLVVGLSLWVILIQPSMARISRAYALLPNQPRPWLVFPWDPPTWLVPSLSLLSLAVAASMGLWTALLVRPRHSRADLAAGGVTGLVAGLVVFLTSFGWSAVMLRSATSHKDLWLVTQAAWSERPEVASRQLVERYPDLRHVPAAERGAVVFDMLLAEQLTAMPTGLWAGMFLSLALGIVLGISGTMAAGSLVRQDNGRWGLLLRYLEITFPAAVLLGQLFLLGVLGLFATTQLNLPWWHPPLVLATSGLAIAAALRRWPWPVRLTLFLLLAAVVLTSSFFEIRG
jgi:hypothetical protein